MTDWRNDLMDAILDMRREARSGDGDTSFPEERIDRAVEAARAEAWDEGNVAAYSNPYRKEN